MKRKLTIIIIMAAMLSTQGLVAQTANQDTTIVMPATGIMAIHPSRNFTGDKGLVVCSCFDSRTSGLYFTKYILNEVIVGSSANSSSALFLLGKPGTYTLTLTDRTATKQFFSTSVSWVDEAGTVDESSKQRAVYKFVNETGRVGFERDETYAGENYYKCDMAEGEHVYFAIGEKNMERICATMETTAADLSFIPWSEELWGCPVIDAAAGIHTISRSPLTTGYCFDLQGRRINVEPQHGIYILNGKKYIK